MRKVENIQLVMFKCDHCETETGFRPNAIGINGATGEPVHPFPYSEGWIYSHELKLKVSPIHSLVLERMHFCSEKCYIRHTEDAIAKLNNLIKRRKN
jgi:hypothetical protein